MNKIRILFVSNFVINKSIFQAGHQSFNYYLSKFCEDEAFHVGYVVEHAGSDDFKKMKSQFHNARDFSIAAPAGPMYLRIARYICYKTFIRYILAAIKPEWLYISPFRFFAYTKALHEVRKKGWIPDVIVFEWTEKIFLKNICQKLFNNALLVATEHDVSFKKIRRQYGKNIFFRLFLIKRLKNIELSVLRTLDLIILLSSDDLLLLENNQVNKNKMMLISPYYNKTNQQQSNIESKIVFYGAMNRAENQKAVKWFIDNVFIPYELYNLFTFTVIGAGLPEKIKEKYSTVKNLYFTGFVEHPEEYFKTALCMVVPLTYGGGIKIKVLEAMSSSVTVLSNKIGIEGIEAVNNVSYIFCHEPIDYRNAILKLHNNHTFAFSIGKAAREMIGLKYNYEKGYNDYKEKIIALHNNRIASLTH
jgi:glycosyltransferase involved in cell wall biosynthesis